MASVTKLHPSGGTANGRPIKITQTVTAGTIFHTSGGLDEIYMWLYNTSAADVLVTVEFGGVTSPDDLKKITVPANDWVLAVPGIPLASGLVCRAFAASANVVNMSGHVNRVTQP